MPGSVDELFETSGGKAAIWFASLGEVPAGGNAGRLLSIPGSDDELFETSGGRAAIWPGGGASDGKAGTPLSIPGSDEELFETSGGGRAAISEEGLTPGSSELGKGGNDVSLGFVEGSAGKLELSGVPGVPAGIEESPAAGNEGAMVESPEGRGGKPPASDEGGSAGAAAPLSPGKGGKPSAPFPTGANAVFGLVLSAGNGGREPVPLISPLAAGKAGNPELSVIAAPLG